MYDCRQLLQLDTLVYGKIDLYFSTEIVDCVELARNFNPIFIIFIGSWLHSSFGGRGF